MAYVCTPDDANGDGIPDSAGQGWMLDINQMSAGAGPSTQAPPTAPAKEKTFPYLQAFNAGFRAISARNQARGQRSVLGYEAQVAGNNAAMAGYQAGIAQQVGERNEQSSMLHTANVFSTQRANMAAGGIDLGQGSATEVLASTEYMGQREAAAIHDDTARQVWSLNNQKAQFLAEQQAKLAQRDAINPDMAAFGSLLGSASSYSGWN